MGKQDNLIPPKNDEHQSGKHCTESCKCWSCMKSIDVHFEQQLSQLVGDFILTSEVLVKGQGITINNAWHRIGIVSRKF